MLAIYENICRDDHILTVNDHLIWLVALTPLKNDGLRQLGRINYPIPSGNLT